MSTECCITIADQIRHELAKPRANVQMFFEILPEIAKKPKDIDRWRSNILRSFENTEKVLETLILEAVSEKKSFPLVHVTKGV